MHISPEPTYITAMQRLFLTGIMMLLCIVPTVSAQYINSNTAPEGYELSVDTVSADIGLLVGVTGTVDLTGYACYRLYVELVNEDDFLSSISGDVLNPTYVYTTTAFHHAAIGGLTASNSNSLLFPVYPDLQYDSYVTIGLEGPANAAAGEANISTVQSTGNPWATVFDPGFGTAGASITIDDPIGGAWYALNGDSNGVPGAALRILVGQFTTDGDISGQLYTQVFINGLGTTEFRDTFFFGPDESTPGCTDNQACNFNLDATEDDGTCEYPMDMYGSTAVDCDGVCFNDADDDDICDEDEIAGCTDVLACNFDGNATDDNGTCTFAEMGYDCDGACLNDADEDEICDEDEIEGCTDVLACNYDNSATDDDGSCASEDVLGVCGGDCFADEDGDGVCDDVDPCLGPSTDAEVLPIIPATMIAQVSYDSQPAFDATVIARVDGQVRGAGQTFEFEGEAFVNLAIYAETGDQVSFSVFREATCEDCEAAGATTTVWSLGAELGSFAEPAAIDALCAGSLTGCTDTQACNFDAIATIDDGSCTFAEVGYDCQGNCLEDADGDGICDGDDPCLEPDLTAEVLPIIPATFIATVSFDGATSNDIWVLARVDGQTRGAAEPFMFEGTAYVNISVYAEAGETVEFSIFNPATCNECLVLWEVQISSEGESWGSYETPLAFDALCNPLWGCMDESACNFDNTANLDNEDCTYADVGYDCDGACLEDADGDGICDEDEIEGCTEIEACNYNATATDNDGTCDFESCAGCMDALACNFDETATLDSGDCEFTSCAGCMDALACNYDSEAALDDGSCEYESCAGCMDPGACNFDLEATIDGGGCQYAEVGYDCDGACLNDADADGVCDEDEILGCTDSAACNFDESATDDDASCEYASCEGCMDELACNFNMEASIDNGECTYAEAGYDCDGACLEDADGDGVCDGDEIEGCTDTAACNFDEAATDDDASCEYTSCAGCMDELACNFNVEASIDSGECTYAEAGYDCDGACLEDADGDGVCDGDEIEGCTDTEACNYNDEASDDDGSCEYAEAGFDCNGNTLGLDPCDPECLVITPGIEDYTLECLEDFEGLGCDDITVVNNCTEDILDWGCYSAPNLEGYTIGTATTAMGNGPDAVIRIYGLAMQGFAASDFFLEVGDGLSFTQYDNGTAVLEGEIANELNPNQRWQVFYVFEDGMDGGTWGDLGRGYKHLFACDSIPFEDWTIYILQGDQSYLHGLGDYEGSLLHVGHAPVSQYFGFQVGESANDHNCNMGMGGWFNWSGQIGGTPVMGSMGDVIADVTLTDVPNEGPEACQTNIYTVFGDSCGIYTYEQQVCRLDTTAPVFTACPSDTILACGEDLPELGWVEAQDNCDDAGSPEISYLGEFEVAFDATSCYTLERRWQAEDLFGNISYCTQTLQIVDSIAPQVSIEIPGDVTLNVNALCGVFDDPEMTGYATFEASDNCVLGGTELAYEDFTVDSVSSGCFTTERVWTATVSDSCGNVSEVSETQHLYVQDIITPSIGLSNVEVELACDQWVCDIEQLVEYGILTYADNCVIDTAYATCYGMSGGCVTPAPTFNVVYTVVDACGNTALESQFIALIDSVSPEISLVCPPDTTVLLDAFCEADWSVSALAPVQVSVSDNCDAAPSLDVDVVDSEPNWLCETGEGSFEVTRTWTASSVDHCGNTVTENCSVLITVLDVTAPEMVSIDCPADTTVVLDAACEVNLGLDALGNASGAAEDGCDSAPDVSIFHIDGPSAYSCTGDDAQTQGSYTFERTFYAYTMDDCGNVGDTISCVQTVEVLDQTAPVFIDADSSVTVSCELLYDPTDPSLVALDFGDSCDDDVAVSVSAVAVEGTGSCPGTWMRSWTITDDCGNSATFDQEVVLIDTTAPGIECPADIEIYLDENPNDDTTTVALGMPEVSDNCAGLEALVIDYVDIDFVVACDGDDLTPEGTSTFTRTFTVTDECGNSSSCDQLVNLLDTVAPVATLTDSVVACEVYDPSTAYTEWTASDNTDSDVAFSWVEDSVYAVECAGSFKVDRTYTFVDDCGNTLPVQQTVTVVDLNAPYVVDGVTPYALACEEYTSDNNAPALISVEDGCGGDVDLVWTDTMFSGGCVQPFGLVLREYTFTDDCGNAGTFEQYLELYDETPPVVSIECPADTVLVVDADCMTDLSVDLLGWAEVSATDNCGVDEPAIEITFEDGLPLPGCIGEYTLVRTFTAVATDHCGNTDTTSCDMTITVIDVTGPATSVVCPPDTTVSLDADCSADLSYDALGSPAVSALDACDPATGTSWWYQDSDSTMLCEGEDGGDQGSFTFERTFYATSVDGCGNLGDTVSCVQTITALDITAPVLEGEFNTFVACDIFSPDSVYALTASDGCDSDVQIVITAAYPVSASCAGTWLREYDAYDNCGNSSHYTQIINLIDTVAPVITLVCDDDLALYADADCFADTTVAALGEALVIYSDNCDEDLETSYSYYDELVSADCAGSYSFIRTFTATAMDMCDNFTSISCAQLVSVSDTIAPVWTVEIETLPADTTVACGSVPAADVLEAVDGCDADIEVLFDEETIGGECAGEYTLLRSWMVSDACGNEVSHAQVVTVIDTVAPVFTTDLPADTTVSCLSIPEPAEMAIFELCDPTAEIVFYQWSTPGDCGDTEVITRSWSAVDCAGNAVQHEQVVNVIDDSAPVFEGAMEIELSCELWDESAVYVTAYDPCGGEVDIVMEDLMPFSGSCVASYLVTYTATDGCGNSTEMIQNITLIDTAAPVFTEVPTDLTLQCGDDVAPEFTGEAAAEDLCDGNVEVEYTDAVEPGSCDGVMTVVRTWTAEDMCGNTASASQTINVVDTVGPAFVEGLPEDLTASCDAVPVVEVLTASDACAGAVAVSFSADTSGLGDCPSEFTITRVWTAEDCSANAVTHVQLIEVTDEVAPQFVSGPADAVVACDEVPEPAGLEALEATDNCSGAVTIEFVGETSSEGDCPQSWTLTRVWRASDCAGNTSDWTQVLSVEDITAPELSLNFGDMSVVCAADVPQLMATATDGCDAEPVLAAWIDTLSSDGCGNSVVAYGFSATDGCGNTAVQTVTITVNDTAAPAWTSTCDLADGALTTYCAEDYTGEAPEFPGFCETAAEDGCGGEVELAWSASFEGGFAPNDSVTQFCATATPEAWEGGMTCTGYDPHDMRMFNFTGDEFYVSVGEGIVSQMADGSWTITQTVASLENPAAGFDIEVLLTGGMDWNAWDNQPFETDFKQDCEDLPDLHEDWMYWILSSGTLSGWGEYAGSEMTLSHQPANLFYGFQVGVAANNMNDAYGYSGWFFYEGTFDGEPINGSGDLFGELDCVLPYTVSYTHTATDCSGNVAAFEHSVEVNGGDCEDAGVAPVEPGAGFSTADNSELADGQAVPVRMASLSPNPASSTTRIGFEVDRLMRVNIDLIGMDGRSTEALYSGSAEPGHTYLLDIWVEDLPSGVYQVRVAGAEHQITKRLVIQK